MFAALGLIFITSNKALDRNNILPRSIHGVVGAIVSFAKPSQAKSPTSKPNPLVLRTCPCLRFSSLRGSHACDLFFSRKGARRRSPGLDVALFLSASVGPADEFLVAAGAGGRVQSFDSGTRIRENVGKAPSTAVCSFNPRTYALVSVEGSHLGLSRKQHAVIFSAGSSATGVCDLPC